MSIDNISLGSEPHPLRDEPLPVCIPAAVSKYPRGWRLNDGHPPPASPIPLQGIYATEPNLKGFVSISQTVLLHLVSRLSDGRDFMQRTLDPFYEVLSLCQVR